MAQLRKAPRSRRPYHYSYYRFLVLLLPLFTLTLIYYYYYTNEVSNSNIDTLFVSHNPHVFSKTVFLHQASTVQRAFQQQGWTITHRRSQADVVWHKKGGDYPYHLLAQYQFANHFPGESFLQSKAKMFQGLRKYNPTYIPETYLLYDTQDRKQFLKRLEEQTHNHNKKPWVLKYLAKDNGKGITIYGPDQLGPLQQELQHKNKDKHIIQEYILNELTYKQHKFDLRCFFFVASLKPLVVFYGHGYLRVSQHHYQELDFSNTHAHLTNVGQNAKNNTQDVPTIVSFQDWKTELAKVKSIPQHADNDPLQHIEDQIAHIIADAIQAFRTKFYPQNTRNGCSILGADFIIDANLKVWLTELQRGPGLGHEEIPAKYEFNQQILPATVDLIEQVLTRQRRNEPILPLESDFYKLIYTDDYQFRYNHM